MKHIFATLTAALCLAAPIVADRAAAHDGSHDIQLAALSTDSSQTAMPPEKLNAYVGCINRLSGRAYDARARYFSWIGSPNGPTGRERIVYGTYTIYNTSDCRKDVEAANASEPHDATLEADGSAYVAAVSKLEPLLKDADDYYTQENYKDDKMAKGKAMHPGLVAAWDAFALADRNLRDAVEAINDRRAIAKLAEIEHSEGHTQHYYVEALMIEAKRVLHAATPMPDLAALETALNAYDATVQSAEKTPGADRETQIGSIFLGSAKSFLVTAKQAMRRSRDKVPYTTGERMMLNASGAGWMVEGSPQRLLRDYNELVDSYNRGPGI